MPIRIQSSHAHDDRGLDAYFTCTEAVQAFLRLEADHLPLCIWEPAAGDGAIVKPLRKAGHIVFASDIADYGLGGCEIADYLRTPVIDGVEGIVTNPPYQLAEEFAKKAIAEVPYVALFVRTNWVMEGTARGKWLDAHPPTREWRSAQRFPMMHRHGWQGPRSTSNTPYAWIVWQRGAPQEVARRFYWRELLKGLPPKLPFEPTYPGPGRTDPSDYMRD